LDFRLQLYILAFLGVTLRIKNENVDIFLTIEKAKL